MENIRGVTDEPLSLKKEWVSLVLLPMAIKVPGLLLRYFIHAFINLLLSYNTSEFLKVATSNEKRVRCCEVVVGSSLVSKF